MLSNILGLLVLQMAEVDRGIQFSEELWHILHTSESLSPPFESSMENIGGTGMFLTLGVIVLVLAGASLLIVRRNSKTSERQMEEHSITADDLHAMLASGQDVLLFDVRQPLDLLAYPEIIPKAQRIPPDELLAKPSLLPKEKDAVVYCTCPSDKTSRAVLRRAMSLHFLRIKFLKGGLASWKSKGYPVEPYKEVFHLYNPTVAPRSG